MTILPQSQILSKKKLEFLEKMEFLGKISEKKIRENAKIPEKNFVKT